MWTILQHTSTPSIDWWTFQAGTPQWLRQRFVIAATTVSASTAWSRWYCWLPPYFSSATYALTSQLPHEDNLRLIVEMCIAVQVLTSSICGLQSFRFRSWKVDTCWTCSISLASQQVKNNCKLSEALLQTVSNVFEMSFPKSFL